MIAVCGEVSFTVDNDGCAFNPFGAIVRDPGACGPLANIISAREDSRSLDVSDLDDVFVLGKYVAELLTGCTMSHRPVDVLQNFSGVSWAVAYEFLYFFTDAGCFHIHFLLVNIGRSFLGNATVS